jgi:phospholipid-binding lipoprotein MlaA
MMKNFLKLFLLVILLSSNAFAGSDGELTLSKKSQTAKDCFEPLNRATFAFNMGLDKVIFKPVAKSYRSLPPSIKTGTGNILSNLSNLITIPNNILQGEFKKAGVNTGRLVVNTTVGILGLVDAADKLGFPKYEKEDYGQTLGTWGIGPGCYLILPVLGPSTVRDTAGSFMNVIGGDPWYNASIAGNNEFLTDKTFLASKVLNGVDFRAKNIDTLDNLEKNSMDFYASVRSLYLQDRRLKINNTKNVKGNIEIIYNEDEWEEIDSN